MTLLMPPDSAEMKGSGDRSFVAASSRSSANGEGAKSFVTQLGFLASNLKVLG